MFLGLDAADQMLILKEIAHFRLKLVQGISVIQAECDSNNEATLDFAPPVMSFHLVEMAPCNFINLVLNPYRSQLAKFWPDENIDLIEQHQ
jgi:flagellar biosynthesis protein FliQ